PPPRIAHRAVAGLTAGDARHEEATAVAGALVDGDDLDCRHPADIGQRQFCRPVDLTLDLDREFVGIDIERQTGEMIAYEKRIVRGDHTLVEYRERGFQLRRPAGNADHRPLLRVFDDRPLAIV